MSDTDQLSSMIDSSGLPDDENGVQTRTEKGPLAFRTISEVADELHVPQHVLRFWETRFEQVRPLKRGGGRRYYRPADVDLLRHISDLLYAKGYTVKGVQRLLREGTVETDAAPQNPVVMETVADVLPHEPAAPTSEGAQEGVSSAAEPAENTHVVENFASADVLEEQPADADADADEGGVEDAIGQLHHSADLQQETQIVLDQPDEVASPQDNAVEAAPAPAPAPETASAEVVRRLEMRNVRLRNDLADILVELEAFRTRITA